MICDKHGNEQGLAKLTDVMLLPTGKFNLFSVTKLLKEGWKLNGDLKKMCLVKGEKTITFDIVIPTPKGVLFAMYMKRTTEIAGATTDVPQKKLNIQQAHDQLGHLSEDSVRQTAKVLEWTISVGGLKPCDSCAAGKAKQKNVSKNSDHQPATMTNERIFLDIATLKSPPEGPNVTKPNWRIMVDERTQLKFSDFFETKNGMIEPTCEQFQKWHQHGMPVKYVRLDNAGENK
jgi:hypothetical protein